MYVHEVGHHFIQSTLTQSYDQLNATGIIHEVLADYFAAAFRDNPDLVVRNMDQFHSFDEVRDSTPLANEFYQAGHPLRYMLW